MIALLGHPVPAAQFINAKPATEGVRKGLLPPFPRTMHDETFLRGAWPTDRNGVVQFTSASLNHTPFPLPVIFMSVLNVKPSTLDITPGEQPTSTPRSSRSGKLSPRTTPTRPADSHMLVSSSLMRS